MFEYHVEDSKGGCCFLLQVLFGPMVQLYPPGHPLDPERRDGLNGPEFARAITIGDNCWIGGGAIIMGEGQ